MGFPKDHLLVGPENSPLQSKPQKKVKVALPVFVTPKFARHPGASRDPGQNPTSPRKSLSNGFMASNPQLLPHDINLFHLISRISEIWSDMELS